MQQFCNYFWAGLYNLFREHFRLRSYRNDCPYEPSYNSTGMTEVINQYSPALLKHIDNYNNTGTNVRKLYSACTRTSTNVYVTYIGSKTNNNSFSLINLLKSNS